jgi:hypothetical protein
VWQESSKRIQKLALMARDGKELLTLFFEKLDDTEVVEAIVVARMIWLRRNSFAFGNEFHSPQRLVDLSKVPLKEFSIAQHTQERPSMASTV